MSTCRLIPARGEGRSRPKRRSTRSSSTWTRRRPPARSRHNRSVTAVGCRWGSTTTMAANTPSCTRRWVFARCIRRTAGRRGRRTSQAAGVPLSKSWAVSGLPQSADAEATSRPPATDLERAGMEPNLLWFDYGDEIAFSEWVELRVQDDDRPGQSMEADGQARRCDRAICGSTGCRPTGRRAAPRGLLAGRTGGRSTLGLLRPDSSAAAAAANPRLYVDSLLFYEDTAIRFAAEGAKEVTAASARTCCAGPTTRAIRSTIRTAPCT